VLVDDLTGDGLTDLAFTSHSGGFVQIYRQVAPRRFEAAAEQEVAGFHPDDTIELRGSPKRYLINAEGDGKLKVVAAGADGRLTLISEYRLAGPRASTAFSWPGWGQSLAIVPYSGKTLTLLRDFDPEKAQAKSVYRLDLSPEPKHVRLGDLTGDGVDELVFTVRRKSEVWLIEYPGPDKEPVPRRVQAFEGGWPRHVIPFDVDRNGTLDLLVPMAVRQEIAVLLNDGKANFTPGKAIPYPLKPGIHVMTAAQDKDGTRYLLAGGVKSLVLYKEGEVAGDFGNVLLPLITWPNWVELKDVDGDGWLDAVVAMQGNPPSLVIYGPLWEAFAKLAGAGS
jgi:hypothetical protein